MVPVVPVVPGAPGEWWGLLPVPGGCCTSGIGDTGGAAGTRGRKLEYFPSSHYFEGLWALFSQLMLVFSSFLSPPPPLQQEMPHQWFALGLLPRAQLLGRLRKEMGPLMSGPRKQRPRADICSRSLCCTSSSFNAERGKAVGRKRLNGTVMLLLLGQGVGVTIREKSAYSLIFP